MEFIVIAHLSSDGVSFAGDDSKFDIDRMTGIVRLKERLDYETKTLHQMIIRAKDNGTAPLKSTCTLTVSS